MPGDLFEKNYPIRYFELDSNAELRFGSLLDFLQDIAGEDAVRRGFGVEQLLPRGLTWMLSRYRIQLDRVVGLGESLRIRTWPSSHKGLSACREFEIFCGGERLGVASTAWMLIDLNSRRPVRPHEKLGEVALVDRQVFADPLAALKPAETVEASSCFRARRADLDLNRHVNNRVFFDWAVEALLQEWIDSCRLAQVDINFLAEVLAGDEILSSCGRQRTVEGMLCSHLITRQDDGATLARLQTRWVQR